MKLFCMLNLSHIVSNCSNCSNGIVPSIDYFFKVLLYPVVLHLLFSSYFLPHVSMLNYVILFYHIFHKKCDIKLSHFSIIVKAVQYAF